jgi:hypothetical protein
MTAVRQAAGRSPRHLSWGRAARTEALTMTGRYRHCCPSDTEVAAGGG